ncbi:MAG: NAD(P)H-hydrate epimerase [Phycisphaeraceae bacterium]
MLDYPERTFTRDAIRQVDAAAVERFAMPSIVLMENASRGIADCAISMIRWPTHRRVLILCGGGNNGGDGFATARHLHNLGLDCTLLLTKPADSYKADAATNLRICQAMQLNILEAADDPLAAVHDLPGHDLLIDALMGTGLTSALKPPLADLVTWINEDQPAPVLAVDIPTGLDCDTGQPFADSPAVRAAVTATMVGRKQGFLHHDARQYTGDVYLVDIGVPRQLIIQLGNTPEE